MGFPRSLDRRSYSPTRLSRNSITTSRRSRHQRCRNPVLPYASRRGGGFPADFAAADPRRRLLRLLVLDEVDVFAELGERVELNSTWVAKDIPVYFRALWGFFVSVN